MIPASLFRGDCIVSIPPISQEKLVEQTLKRQLFSMFDLDLNSGSWFLEWTSTLEIKHVSNLYL